MKTNSEVGATPASEQTTSGQKVDVDVDSFEVPYIAWEIGNECNMKCDFCYSSSLNKARRVEEQIPPNPSVETIIDGLKRLKESNLQAKYINWSGGEPLLRHKDILEIFKESNRLGFKNILSTNCMFTPLFQKEEKEAKLEFTKFLDGLNDYLDFISISWDANEQEKNDDLRCNGHFEDVQTFLNIFKEERYTFKLKVNTVVTKKNINSVDGILDTLKDIPCIWKIVQFNPRECLEKNRRDYEITKAEFLELFDNINSENNALPKTSKCTIINRLYDGKDEPYCFLVIDTKGDVLLPKGEEHIPLANIFEEEYKPDDFKMQVCQRISSEMVNTHIYKMKSDNGKKSPLKVFSEINKGILNRSYLHCVFNEGEAKRKLNKLQSIERGLLSDISGWYSNEFYEFETDEKKENEEKKKEEKEKEFCNSLCGNITNSGTKAPGYNRVKFLLEQEKVEKLLYQSWGIVGGSVAVLNYCENYKGISPRITPCVDRYPEGIHFPWCFDSFQEKRKFFIALFAGGITPTKVSMNSTEWDIINIFIFRRELPESILTDAIEKTINSTRTSKDGVLDSIKGYIGDAEYKKEDWITQCRNAFVLTVCVEMVLSVLAKASSFKSGIIDSIHEIFNDEEKEKQYLSEFERKLGVMMVPAEEATSVVSEWLEKLTSDITLLKNIAESWWDIERHARVKRWQNYQNSKIKKKLQYNYPMRGAYSKEVKQRFSPVFWLYLFGPFIKNKKSLDFPHVLFVKMQKLKLKKTENTNEDAISSFAVVYFTDTVFQKFWNNQAEIWSADASDVNEIDLKSYIHNIANLIYPVASYNINLELNEERKAEIVRQGTKAAVTAIMSRNLSHNIGSHVLSYWNQEIEEGIRNISDFNKEQTNLKKSKDLFQYIQHRMDFLAEVSTTIPSWEMTLDIKTDIIDPYFINPNSDHFESTIKDNPSILLGNIAKSEGINLFERNHIGNKKIVLNTVEMGENRRVSIPHGHIGTHAIYAILENFIRNAAKHYTGAKKDSLPMIKIVVKKPKNPAWENDYFVMRIWDMREDSCDIDAVNKLRKYLPGSKAYAFTKDGELEHGGWGIKEILTATNFLRKKKPEYLMTGVSKKEPPLLEILCGEGSEKTGDCCKNEIGETLCVREDGVYNNKLGIRLYLRKPKDLLITVESLKDIISKDKFEIKYESLDECPGREVPYRMMVVKTEDEKTKYENDPQKPCRIMVYKNAIYGKIDDDYYLDLYKEFINTLDCNCGMPKIAKDFNILIDRFSVPHGLIADVDLSGTVDTENTIIFYYHLNELFSWELSKFKNKWDMVYVNSCYLQPLSGGYSTLSKFVKANRPSDKDKNLLTHFYLELIESALTRVIIVDERISAWSKQILCHNDRTIISIKDMLCKMKVYVADVITENITCENLTTELENARKKGFDVFGENWQHNAHFFVIHQGILDKIEKEKTETGKTKKFLNDIKCKWKVVDSGRGVPTEELKEYGNVRFIEISALQKMLENYDKHALVQTLFSLRKP